MQKSVRKPALISYLFISPFSKSTEKDYVRSHVLAGILSEAISPIKEKLESFGSKLEISHKGFGLEVCEA